MSAAIMVAVKALLLWPFCTQCGVVSPMSSVWSYRTGICVTEKGKHLKIHGRWQGFSNMSSDCCQPLKPALSLLLSPVYQQPWYRLSLLSTRKDSNYQRHLWVEEWKTIFSCFLKKAALMDFHILYFFSMLAPWGCLHIKMPSYQDFFQQVEPLGAVSI